MRRSLGKLSHPTIGHTSRRALLLSSPFDFSTSARNNGGDGGGGRGSDFPKFSFIDSSPDDETSIRAPLGHGRGKPLPPPQNIPQFSSFGPPGDNRGVAVGRGRGSVPPLPQSEENLKPRTPIFFRKDREEVLPPKAPTQDQPENHTLPSSILSVLSGAGRGRPTSAAPHVNEKIEEVNRHIKPRQPVNQEPRPTSPKMSREEAVNKARGVLSRGEDGGGGTLGGSRGVSTRGGGGRGQRGNWSDRGRGRGRGQGGGRGRRSSYQDDDDDKDEDEEETEADKANDAKLGKYLGPEKMELLVQAFEEASGKVLPSPEEDAYVDAMHTNLLVLLIFF
ncbi:hypothetical protein L1987_69821 [Smallanthus sonchifolius]|uniref:Uncharacterized protein n=1 Tax=Smallanthus sonchifolius TaxID=185202 RepID=A0ACB9B607_9ASTR|nr:hypothetical protein L1987_69821 [Smallanthus sonchifolius]